MVVSLKRGELFLGWVSKCMGKRVWCVVWACIEFWGLLFFWRIRKVKFLQKMVFSCVVFFGLPRF